MDNNINGEIDKILDEINLKIVNEVAAEGTAEEKVEETNPGECWALVCYTEKTMFQKITYNLKKLFNYAKERILGRA